MKASDIERRCQETVFGEDHPQIMWLTGTTLKDFLSRIGVTQMVTSEGEMILDWLFYAVTPDGIFRAE